MKKIAVYCFSLGILTCILSCNKVEDDSLVGFKDFTHFKGQPWVVSFHLTEKESTSCDGLADPPQASFYEDGRLKPPPNPEPPTNFRAGFAEKDAKNANYKVYFDGWYHDGEKWDFSKPVTQNLELIAKWEPTIAQARDSNHLERLLTEGKLQEKQIDISKITN